MEPLTEPIPRRQYGRTDEQLSVIGFGGMLVQDVTPKEAVNFVAQAVDRGINYFDVAPFYGVQRSVLLTNECIDELGATLTQVKRQSEVR